MSLETKPTILAIESSCDETSASVIYNGKILSNCISSQPIHSNYGGVVPELASRDHQKAIVYIVDSALKQAKVKKTELNAIAITKGPGLLGALLVGMSFAKAMSQALNIPLIEVNHMQAHVLAHFIEDPKPQFPFLCLTVSGGHTQLVLVKDHLNMKVVGQTIDDAAGEAFDKSAKLMGLPYPGGPFIDKLAAKGDENRFKFSKTKVAKLDYSFSGLKTSILYFLQKEIKKEEKFIQNNQADLAASIQKAIIDMLFQKLIIAMEQENLKNIAIAGGVAANNGLRKRLQEEASKRNWNYYTPKFEYCTDNAAMIAIVAHYKYLSGEFVGLDITPDPRMKL